MACVVARCAYCEIGYSNVCGSCLGSSRVACALIVCVAAVRILTVFSACAEHIDRYYAIAFCGSDRDCSFTGCAKIVGCAECPSRAVVCCACKAEVCRVVSVCRLYVVAPVKSYARYGVISVISVISAACCENVCCKCACEHYEEKCECDYLCDLLGCHNFNLL